MSLKIQLLVIIVSFFFGILFELLNNINYKIIHHDKKIIKVIYTFLLILLESILYFYILLKINNGIIHIYGILAIIFGILVIHFVNKAIIHFTKK